MTHETFGELTWDEDLDLWATSVPLPFFAGSGGNIDRVVAPHDGPLPPVERELTGRQVAAKQELDALARTLPLGERLMLGALQVFGAAVAAMPASKNVEEDDDPLSPERLFREGRCWVTIAAANPSRPPSAGQQAAWTKLLERGDALWDEVMARAFAEYRVQQPVRVRWWRAVYDDYRLEHALPEISCPAEMRHLIRPRQLEVRAAPKKAAAADIILHFESSWHRDGFCVLIRDGQVADLDSGWKLAGDQPRPRARLTHPVFGTLARMQDGRPWEGTVRVPAFGEYLMVAEQRASFRKDRKSFGPPQSNMPWEFVYGAFDLRVHTAPGEEPSEGQAQALAAFLQDEREHVAAITDWLFEHYTTHYETHRRDFQDRYRDENVPKLESPEGLRELIQLYQLHVHPERDGEVALGFWLLRSWDPGSDSDAAFPGPDLGLRWRDGQIEEMGPGVAARPRAV